MFRPGQPSDTKQAPVAVRQMIEASQKWFNDQGQDATLAAQAIIARRASQIHQFYNAQSANRDISGLAISRTHLSLGDVDLTYEINNGQAILSVVVFPENVKPSKNPLGDIEINLDGYFSWTHIDPDFPGITGSTSGPYDVYLNEYLLMENIAIDRACSSFLVLFGSTALRVPSLMDKPDSDIEHNPLADPANGGLVQGVLPLRKQIEVSTAPDGGPYPAHNDLFGYWIFDWLNRLNPGEYVVVTSEDVTTWKDLGYAPPDVVKGIQFADPKNSPLVSDSLNNFSITLSPFNTTNEFETNIRKVVQAEFYDRGEMKTAQRSWTKSNLPSVIVNDKPLLYCASRRHIEPEGGIGLRVNLDPKIKPEDHDDDLVTGIIHDGVPADGTGLGADPPTNGVSADQIAANAAYSIAVQALTDAYYASIAAQLAAAQVTFSATQNAYFSALADYSVLDGSDLPQAPGGTPILTMLNAGYVLTTTTKINGFNTLDYVLAHMPTQRPFPLPQIDLNALAEKITNVAKAGQPYLDATTAYVNLKTSQPPNLPPRPVAAGKKLNDFVYRLFTVSGDQWQFGDWQNR